MAKMRGIKPETFTDDKILQLTPLARWLFVGMWTIACDNGHVEDNLVQLKVRLLPVDSCNVSDLLTELTDTGRVERHAGYLKIVKLTEHQKIDKRYLRLCEWCNHDQNTTFTDSDRPARASRSHPKHGGGTPGAHRAAGVETVIPLQGHTAEGEGEGEGERTTSASTDVERDTFPDFWTVYPRKRSKGQAVKAYKAALKKASAETILAGLHAHLPAWAGKSPEYIPYPATWLNGESWADEMDDDIEADPWAHLKTPEQIRQERGF